MGDDFDPELALRRLEGEYEQGNNRGSAVLAAINICAHHELPLPRWAAEGFIHRYWRWQGFEARTLDEAFNVELPIKTRIPDLRRKRVLQGWVWQYITDRREAGAAVQEGLFERCAEWLRVHRLAERHGLKPISAKTVEAYYYDMRDRKPRRS